MMDAEIVSRRSSLKITKSSDIAANYDYCMVFKLKTDQTTGKLRQSNTAKYCVNKMKEKGLETFNYLSVQRDELIVLIRCPVSLFFLSDFVLCFSSSSYYIAKSHEGIC